MKHKKFSRRQILKTGAVALGALALPRQLHHIAAPLLRAPAGGAGKGMNVLFMTADDLGWKDLSCDGNVNVRTPHLDALAVQGTRFSRAFGASSSCSSSRASFITGQYVSTHGVDGLTHRYPLRQLGPFQPTLAEAFKRAGYATAIQGKWHVAPFIPVAFYGYESFLGGPLPTNHIKDTEKIERYLRARAKDRVPFYLELNFTDTHRSANGKIPRDPDFVVDPETITVPEWMGLPDWPEIREDLARYYGKLQRTDHLVGRTLEALRATGLAENTIVVFVSDNGSPFPGNKMTLLDRGIGTPLLVRLPAQISPGRASDALVSTIDIMPSLLELTGLAVHRRVEGVSFAPLLLDETKASHRQYVCAEMNRHVKAIPMRAIRSDRWKAILNLSDSPIGLDDLAGVPWAERLCELDDQPWRRPRPEFELYDLWSDPQERSNLAGRAEVASVEAEMRKLLQSGWKKLG